MTRYFNLNNNEISKELLVKKFNTILDNQGRLATMVTKASPVNLCQIIAYILPVMCSLLSLGDGNRFSRSSHRRYSVKKGILENFETSPEYNCVGLSFNKVEGRQLY